MLLQYLTSGMHRRRLRIFMAEKSRTIMCGDVGAAGMAKAGHNAHACWWQHHQPGETWPFEHDLRPAMESR
ncbi:MAG: hypothetical protein INF74_12565 [Roseomonas sp.]|nr:hypothetical protein [Roseomonas sp.]